VKPSQSHEEPAPVAPDGRRGRRIALLVTLALCGPFALMGQAGVAGARARAFDPATQAHLGACAVAGLRPATAVHDYRVNGVLAAFAGRIGIRARGARLARLMKQALAVGRVTRRVVTDNYGCDGHGSYFSVGARVLGRGELVGLRVPVRLRHRLCRRRGRGCRAVVLHVRVVFPVNCWNLNTGNVTVTIYVRVPHRHRRPPPRHTQPPPKAAKPSATATVDCAVGNGGGVAVTLTNAASATAPASFTVNGSSYGPLAPGASETVDLPLAPDATETVQVVSGTTTLLAQTFTNACAPAPAASSTLTCQGSFPNQGGLLAVTLTDGASATLPASFSVTIAVGSSPSTTTSYGPLDPGQSQTITQTTAPYQQVTVTVSSGGAQIYSDSYRFACQPPTA